MEIDVTVRIRAKHEKFGRIEHFTITEDDLLKLITDKVNEHYYDEPSVDNLEVDAIRP